MKPVEKQFYNVVLSNLPVYDHKKSEWLQFS